MHQNSKSKFKWKVLLLCILCIWLAPSLVWGQAAATAIILGKVTDQSGAVLPGVTVTVTSPALQVPRVSTATDNTGNYQLRDLPAPGVYRVSFEISGFQTLVREDLNLPTGFAARVDASMKIGTITETVEVTGQNPVVDTVDAARLTNIPQQDLRAIPRGGSFQEVYQMSPGISIAGKPDVGDSNLGTRGALSTYGATMNMAIKVEGVEITSAAHDNSASMYISSYNLAEVQIKSTGNQADVAVPGFSMDSITKSGSNQTHGSFLAEWQPGQLQSNNVSPELAAQGITVTNPLKYYYTLAGDIGGHIIRDKLWYYGAVSRQSKKYSSLTAVSGPNAQGCWSCPDSPLGDLFTSVTQYSGKISYQPRNNLRLIGVWSSSYKDTTAFSTSLTTPLPSAGGQRQPVLIYKGEVQWTVSPRVVVNGLFGYSRSETNFRSNSPVVKGNPSSIEQSTGLLTGPANNYNQIQHSFKRPLNANVVYVTGNHQFKFGSDFDLDQGHDTEYRDRPEVGSYQLRFNLGKPYQIVTYSDPVYPSNRYNSQAIYAMDTWKLGRVTLNYGIRVDRYHSYYPDQHKNAGQFSTAADYTGRDIKVWKDVLPRVGAAWDIFGHGKTVVKGSFGIFGDQMLAGFAQSYNPVSRLSTTYRWSGPCVVTAYTNVSYNQPNTSCDVDSAYLATLNPSSPNYVSSSGGSNTRLNSDLLKQPTIYNYTFRLEHELFANTAVSLGYVGYRLKNQFPNINVFPNRPYSAYTVAVPFTDPMTGQAVNIYTYPSSYVGPNYDITERQGGPDDRPDKYNTLEVTLTKRYSHRWNGLISFWTTKNDRWITPVSTSPNTDWFPQDNTRTWEGRVSGMVRGPWGFELWGLYRATAGVQGQRTVRFTSSKLLQGSVTIPIEEFGSQKGPVISVANLKVSRPFKLEGGRSIQASVQFYNAFNNSSATAYNWLTGTLFGRVDAIVDPRVIRMSLEFRF